LQLDCTIRGPLPADKEHKTESALRPPTHPVDSTNTMSVRRVTKQNL
jgi:hypothetical protein